ncbi:hypothetical protein MJL30_39280, partial [Salmonella enterica subsp. enterica serovar Anatum]|nr:hypothetical protein [Salmonella enterica subsp. enterica serovar Anatum]
YCQIALYPSWRGWAFQDRDLGVLVGQPVPRRRAVCHDAGASVSGTLHAFLHYSRMMTIADDALQDGARFFMARMKTPR